MEQMWYKDKIWHKELSTDSLSNTYYVDVLCGEVDEKVDVYNFGVPGGCLPEFTFYYGGNDNLLKLALSANNGWGHANAKCFTPDKYH